MEYTPLSPFKRPLTRAHLQGSDAPPPPALPTPVSKWQLLRELSKAQAAFNLTERDLTVLQGLLSFFPGDSLGGPGDMVVFPSNKTICERLNGMACSTMRRHLARLVDAGVIGRRDSPNGKRYARRLGAERVAFGFDLAPLWHRRDEIGQAAEAARAAQDRLKRLREVVSLMRRDLAALAEYGEGLHPGLGLWDHLRDTAALTARALRRQLAPDDLVPIQAQLAALLDQARECIDGPQTEEMVTSDAEYEQHHQSSDKDLIDLEPAMNAETCDGTDGRRPLPKIPLHLVTTGCPTLHDFHPGQIRHWHQLHAAACLLRPAMGISQSAWEDAQRCMGPEQASVVLAAILERFAEIRSPGGYLRSLTAKAAAGAFSCGPMIMALLGRRPSLPCSQL